MWVTRFGNAGVGGMVSGRMVYEFICEGGILGD